jgi:hypothetical protein
MYFTYLLIPCSIVRLEKPTGVPLVKKFPALYATKITRTLCNPKFHYRNLKCPSPLSILNLLNPVHTPNAASWKLILILSSHLSLGLPIGLFHSGLPTKILYTPLPSSIRTICPAYLILLDFITRKILGEGYGSWSSSLWSFLHYPVTSSLLGLNILQNTIFSNMLSLYSSPMWATKFHTHKRTSKIIGIKIY